jgi:hypothetical membrane protein
MRIRGGGRGARRSGAVDKVLFGAGIVGPPIFIATFLVAGAVRPGYSPWTNFVSQLATGDGGWIQTLNFLVLAALSGAFAVGLLRTGVVGAGLFLSVFAAALLVAGIFPTDPYAGYPPGLPTQQTTHGTVHGVSGLLVFLSNALAAFAVAVHFRKDAGWRTVAAGSALVGVAVLGLFVGTFLVPVGGPTGFVQRITIVVGFGWVSAFAYRMWKTVS